MPGALSIFMLLFVIHYYAPTTRASTNLGSDPYTSYSSSPRKCPIYTRCPRAVQDSISYDSISYGRAAKNLTSVGETFRLGFFERGSNAYLGIWYHEVIVWVANRDNPIPLERPRDYFFNISDDGNAKVFDSNNRSYWSTNHSTTPSSAEQMVLQLSNTGNLILVDRGSKGETLWKSFENPTDTFLPGMDITHSGLALVSWKGPQDAAQGYYSFRKDDESSTLFIYNASATYWDSTYSSLHPNLTSFLWNKMNGISSALRLVMSYTGSVELWELQKRSWSMIWKAPKDRCDLSNACGTFGVCEAGNSLRCKCLPGYEPSNPGNWESEDFSSGCKTRTTDQCGQVFLPLPIVKLPPGPDSDNKGSNETFCRDLCLHDCGCRAYSFDANQSRCRHWTDLTRIQEESTHGQTLYIRVYQSDKVHHKHIPLSLGAGVAAASGIVLLLLGSFLFILRLRRRRAIQRAGLIDQFKTDDIEDIEIPFIDYQSLLDVTDNFSDSNKLGAGGFGPVYKGKLPDGNEVAVKRLSTASAQGIEEFRNEVILIAKLQHRNLVRVLGYCMKEDEKILIYEYMPNKCLSSFIFDQTTSPLLDWTKRFNIILGIARGLVYLHQDSRLRIIHRDLKPSNILLDEELNPKISDFGLARIVAGNEIATSTARVVGTYGYMSPEYALDGYFSIKSDVYSFGIILLEVISGRKCTSLLEFDNILISLLGYAWTLWDKERALELVDKSIVDSCDSFEVKRCINVGLLCVQEDPSDRPTMSTVLLMLGGGDTMSLPHPNQPVFVARRPPLEAASSSSSKFGTSNSNAELSTTLQGR